MFRTFGITGRCLRNKRLFPRSATAVLLGVLAFLPACETQQELQLTVESEIAVELQTESELLASDDRSDPAALDGGSVSETLTDASAAESWDEFRELPDTLAFYSGFQTVMEQMEGFPLLSDTYEVRDDGVTQKLLTYGGVSYLDYPCETVFCFTDQGLIGINYHLNDLQDPAAVSDDCFYKLYTLYGAPATTGDFMTLWDEDPIGEGTKIYLFPYDDKVQISLFA